MRIGQRDANAAEPEVKLTTETLERRAMLRRFGTYAAFTAPALTVLMASRQSEAGGFSRNSAHNTGGNSFGWRRRWRRRWWWRMRLLLLRPERPLGSPGPGHAPAIPLRSHRGRSSFDAHWGDACCRSSRCRWTTLPWSLLRPPERWRVVDAAARAVLEGLRDGQARVGDRRHADPRLRCRALRRSPAGSRFAPGLVAPGQRAQAPHQLRRRRNRSRATRRSTQYTRSVPRRSGSGYGHPGSPCWSVR